MADNDGKSLRRIRTSKRQQDEVEILPPMKLARRTPVPNVFAMKLRSSASTSVAAAGKVDSVEPISIPVSKQKSNKGKHSVDV